MLLYFAYLVLGLSLFNLIRMAYFAIFSDIFDIKNHLKNKKKQRSYQPLVTIIVPAHNEELVLKRNLMSILNSSYKNIELIIANDSSTDRTLAIARNFRRKYRHEFVRIKILTLSVRGKAKALNKGLRYIQGDLFMCLDADSALEPDALFEAVKTFRDKNVGALSANVKIFKGKGLLNKVQRIEYLVCYQMKKAETESNIQYIIGGIGSMFRTKLIKDLGYYETDTITEDIDLSMKFIERYGKKYRISYNPKVVVRTEAVMDFKGLLVQRYRWKYGRYQVFFKRHKLFFSRNYSRKLSWIYLPYALLGELLYLIEPFVIGFLVYLIINYGDWYTFLGSFVVYNIYNFYLIFGSTEGYTQRERYELAVWSPIVYFGMYVISCAEYFATIKGIAKLPEIYRNYRNGEEAKCDWSHVSRSGSAS